MHEYLTYSRSKIHSIQAFNMFIIIHLSKYKCRDLNTRILILEEACPTTGYVAETFHPSIGQCAHQSLNATSTPELGMISTRN